MNEEKGLRKYGLCVLKYYLRNLCKQFKAMEQFNLISYLIFAFVTLLTPGPNNYLLFAHGKHFGRQQAIGLMAGIFSGFVVLLYISGYGIAKIIIEHPTIGLVLKVISSCWFIYLAIILRKLSTDSHTENIKHIGFIPAFLMQFINPKAWIVSIAGASTFLPQMGNIHINVLLFSLSFAVIGIPCMLVWISFGGLISKWLNSEKANRVIGYSIFALMLISVVLIWI